MVVLAMGDREYRERYREFLSSLGFIVAAARDGAEGLSLLFTNVPKILVLDVTLADIDGIDLCRKAREIHGDQISIIFVSTLEDLEVIELCLEAGGNDYLIKSHDLEKFAERVLFWAKASPIHRRQKHRTRTLAAIRAAVLGRTSEAPDTPGGTLSSRTDEVVANSTALINRAREVAGKGFGQTIEEKLYLLGYVAGIIEYWQTLRPHVRVQRDYYMQAVLRETGILSNQEIRLMLSAWDELSKESTFRQALRRGTHDSVARTAKGGDFTPKGLLRFRRERPPAGNDTPSAGAADARRGNANRVG